MKILMLDKYHYIKGGSETYLFALKDILEKKGHEIIMFSMQSDKNFESKYSKYFVKNIDYTQGGINKIKNAVKLINSKEAYNNLCRLIEDTKPDVAHINLIYHQLTPSVIHALKKYNIPMVYVSHDYKIVCPNYKIYNNEVCRKCYGGKYINATKTKCHKNSFINSLLVTIEAYYHKYKKSYELIDKIITPSYFVKEELIKAGIREDKIIALPNFLTIDYNIDLKNIKKENTLLYYGRLSNEKGLFVLMEAIKNIDKNINVKIIGVGPEEEKIRKFIEDEKLKNVKLLGFKSDKELYTEIAKAKCAVLPSIWHETFGLTVTEAFSLGTPVIGSKMGAIQENIINLETGALFDSKDSTDLANKINWLFNLKEEKYINLVQNSINKSKEYDIEKYYKKIINIYEEVLDKKRENIRI
ncbi:glycosyltransferase family 4 protein [Clostridium baratii]|uniref:glycosyltransferase family 4 protein n=1 Tax=Clostridium baratii TaxID=1561 RepID=UPI001C00D693|nr:glycosyltransferase family 4 protein [Clostridium baratii]MBT9830484.1 glycosyltransferase [Clostridium baratii]